MYQSHLLKDIKYHIVCSYKDHGEEVLHVDHILAISATIIYPVINKIRYKELVKFSGSIVNIVAELNVFLKKQSPSKLKKYSAQGLYYFFKEEWVSTLSERTKKRLCLDIEFFKVIRDNGSLKLKGNEKLYNSIIKVGPSPNQLEYGNLDYSFLSPTEFLNIDETNQVYLAKPDDSQGQLELKQQTKPKTNEEAKGLPTVDSSPTISDYDQKIESLVSLWESEIYDEEFNKIMPMVWKLKISSKVYKELKHSLLDVLSYIKDNNSIKESEFVRIHAQKIFVFIAEWYRREYKGSDDKVFEAINYSGNAKKIWLECPKSYQTYLYKSDNTLWLNSIYVLGGLPIKYRTTSLNQFYDSVIGAMEGDEDSFKNDTNFNNTCVTESLKENGSLYEFVNEIISGKSPFFEDDLNTPEVQEFIKYLKEGNERKAHKKFKLEWLVYYTASSSYMSRKLRVHLNPEFNGAQHRYISYKRLTTWGVPSEIQTLPILQFYLKFNEDEEGKVPLLRFINNYNGEFVGWLNNDYKEIKQFIPTCYIDNISIQIEGVETRNGENAKFYKEIQRFNLTPYLQLYPTNTPQEWSSMVKASKKSAVIYRNSLQLLEDETFPQTKQFADSYNSDIYFFHEFFNTCTLLDTDQKTIKLYRKGDALEIRPVLYTSEIDYNTNGTLNCFIQQSQEVLNEIKSEIPVVFGREGLQVFLKEENGEERIAERYTLKFKKENEFNYKDWTQDMSPELGLIRLQARLYDMTTSIDVYYVPCEYIKERRHEKYKPIHRNTITNKINFNTAINNLFYEDIQVKNHVYEDQNCCNSGFISRFYIIQAQDNKKIRLELPVYRAKEIKELEMNGRSITTSECISKKFEVALICKDSVFVKILNNKGFCVLRSEEMDFYLFDKEVEWTARGISQQRQETEHIKYFICHSNPNKRGVYTISNNFKDEYVFYYWDFGLDTKPQKIATNYDEKLKQLTLNHTDLNKPGIIFQSLKHNKRPPRYWEPLFVLKHNIYKKGDSDIIDKCFRIATEHHIYYRIFQPLYYLVSNDGGFNDQRLMDFFFRYAKRQNYQLKKADFQALHRFADEFLFDWFFLCRNLWTRRSEEVKKKQVLKKLFLSNPHIAKKSSLERSAYYKMVDSYWSDNYIDYRDWKVRASKNGGTALCFMSRYSQSINHKYNFTGQKRNIAIIRQFLKDLYTREGYLQNVWDLIQKKLFKTQKI